MRKLLGFILFCISLLFLFVSFENFTGFSILTENNFFHSSFFSVFGFVLLFLSLMIFAKGLISNLEKEVSNIESFKTEKGSIYSYLPDGRTQRYKTFDRTLHNPSDAIVFVPDYKTSQAMASKDLLNKRIFGKDEQEYTKVLLSYMGGSPKSKQAFIINKNGKILTSNKEINTESGNVYFAALNEKGGYDFVLAVSKIPKAGYNAFDMKFLGEDGSKVISRHLGHKVTKIKYKTKA